jgi:hypothetical protein
MSFGSRRRTKRRRRLRSTSAYSPRVIPVGKNLAFVTSEKTVVLIDKERKEVASFSVKE